MKIGIISDTHLGVDTEKLKGFIEKYFTEVDLIIHAGDFNYINVIDTIRRYKEFIGVYGNNDIDIVKKLMDYKRIIEVKGYKVGIIHGHGKEKTTFDRAYNEFLEDNPDIIVFGHSHQPLLKTKGKILMLNPGSLTCKRRERWFSYIILEIKDNNITVTFNFLN